MQWWWQQQQWQQKKQRKASISLPTTEALGLLHGILPGGPESSDLALLGGAAAFRLLHLLSRYQTARDAYAPAFAAAVTGPHHHSIRSFPLSAQSTTSVLQDDQPRLLVNQAPLYPSTAWPLVLALDVPQRTPLVTEHPSPRGGDSDL